MLAHCVQLAAFPPIPGFIEACTLSVALQDVLASAKLCKTFDADVSVSPDHSLVFSFPTPLSEQQRYTGAIPPDAINWHPFLLSCSLLHCLVEINRGERERS